MVDWNKEIDEFRIKYNDMTESTKTDNILYLIGDLIRMRNKPGFVLKDLNDIIYNYGLLFKDDLVIERKERVDK